MKAPNKEKDVFVEIAKGEGYRKISHPIIEDWIWDSLIFKKTPEGIFGMNVIEVEIERKHSFTIGNNDELERLLNTTLLFPDGSWGQFTGRGIYGKGWIVDVGRIILNYPHLREIYGLPSSIPPEEGFRKIEELIVLEEVLHSEVGVEHIGDIDHLRRAGLRLLWDYL